MRPETRGFVMNGLSRRGLVTGCAALAALGPAARPAPHITRVGEMRRTVRIGAVNPRGSAFGQACQAFAEAVAASPVLSGILEVEVITDGILGGELEMTEACINGSLDLAVSATNVMANIVPELGLLDAPFLFRDVDHARAVLDSSIGEELAALMQGKGINPLAWAENGLRHVTANKAIREPSDLHGLHIRVPQSPVMLEVFRALGANAEQLPLPELYDALRTGRFEAQENPIPTIVTANFAKVQSHVSLTGHVYSAASFIVSADLLEDLDKTQRAALVEAAHAGALASRKIGSAGEIRGLDTLRAAGMTVVEDVDRTSLARAARPALDAIVRRLGEERAARIRAFPS